MYEIKMAFALVEVGLNLWVNPVQIQAVTAGTSKGGCQTRIVAAGTDLCSDWPLDKVRAALSAKAVAKALEGK